MAPTFKSNLKLPNDASGRSEGVELCGAEEPAGYTYTWSERKVFHSPPSARNCNETFSTKSHCAAPTPLLAHSHLGNELLALYNLANKSVLNTLPTAHSQMQINDNSHQGAGKSNEVVATLAKKPKTHARQICQIWKLNQHFYLNQLLWQFTYHIIF